MAWAWAEMKQISLFLFHLFCLMYTKGESIEQSLVLALNRLVLLCACKCYKNIFINPVLTCQSIALSQVKG